MDDILQNILSNHPTVFSTLGAALLAAVFAFFTLRHNIKSSRIKNSLDFEATYKHNDGVVAATLEIKKTSQVFGASYFVLGAGRAGSHC